VIYGLYLSATGVLTNSYRQDVIANNIANAETVGFKRDLALFQERLTEAQEVRAGRGGSSFGRFNPAGGPTNDLLEPLGGGLLPAPTRVDNRQGEFEPTGGNLDVAIEGDDAYFLVDDGSGTPRLTRNGQFAIDGQGRLILDGTPHQVLDPDRTPILLDGRLAAQTSIARDGAITQAGQPAGRLGVFRVTDPQHLTKRGGQLLDHPNAVTLAAADDASLRSEFVERANVDPATELASLMDAQRQLEANANMIRYQDQMLSKLVNEVGKIG
jgi:flagellar basal body rod protein FlgG